jgi:hypothetical protein
LFVLFSLGFPFISFLFLSSPSVLSHSARYHSCIHAFFKDAPVGVFDEYKCLPQASKALDNLKISFLEKIYNPSHWKLGCASNSNPSAQAAQDNSRDGKSRHRSYPDDIEALHWIVKNGQKSDWTIAWTFFCRAKLMPKSADSNESYFDNCTKKKAHSIVYKDTSFEVTDPKQWLSQR